MAKLLIEIEGIPEPDIPKCMHCDEFTELFYRMDNGIVKYEDYKVTVTNDQGEVIRESE